MYYLLNNILTRFQIIKYYNRKSLLPHVSEYLNLAEIEAEAVYCIEKIHVRSIPADLKTRAYSMKALTQPGKPQT